MYFRRLLPVIAACAGLVWLPSASGAAEEPPLPQPASEPAPPPPADGSQLPLPKGAKVAIVVFEDLQCPDCARMHPELLAASKRNSVPLVIHDFPIPRHLWAFPAAVVARYFNSLSPALGVEFRSFIFDNQKDITPDNLRDFCERFAREHGVTLPADLNKDGRLSAQVQADFDLGKRIGLSYVPLIFVIGRGAGADHYIEVTDPAAMDDAIARMKGKRAR